MSLPHEVAGQLVSTSLSINAECDFAPGPLPPTDAEAYLSRSRTSKASRNASPM